MDFEDNGFEFKDQILTILSRSEEIDNLGKELNEFHPYDISKAFMELEDSTRKLLFHRLPLTMVANIFEHIESEVQIEWIKALEITFAVQIIDHMETDDAVDLLQYIEDQEEDIDLVNLL
ncbi:MAG: hypothetical protein U1C51_07835, partial [Candidatus Izemoplasmatales bacterium]|nr:hypothetical protein [Candidatus Izemoplasmatales bacterium]